MLDELSPSAFRRTELAAIARLRSRSFSSSAIFSENGRVARCCRIARLLTRINRIRSVIRFSSETYRRIVPVSQAIRTVRVHLWLALRVFACPEQCRRVVKHSCQETLVARGGLR
jgi:hypothetical protein